MSTVEISRPEPGIVVLTLNRPDRLNTINAELVGELHQAFASINADDDCRAVILTGAGTHFCAGADLAGHGVAPHGDGSASPQDWMATQQHISSLIPVMRSLRPPVIAAVRGAAAGGGFAFALASDIRIVSESARFNAAFVRIGLSGCDIGVSWLLPRLVGASIAFELLLTGRFIAAAEALRLGLVAAVVPEEELMTAALECARTIAANSPLGVRMTKEVMWAQLEVSSLRAGIDLENRTQIVTVLSADHREAVAAFLEKREPNFRDR